MAKQVAEIFIQALVNAGIKRVYGVVGDSLNGLTDVIRKSKQIEWLHVRHEEVAAFATGAEAHLTGEIAVCAGSCGLGNLHLINGLFDCHRNRVPVLAIAAQIPRRNAQPSDPRSIASFAHCQIVVTVVWNHDLGGPAR